MSTTSQSGPPDERSALELRKLEAEVQKVQSDRRKAELEILELTHWWRRPAFLQPVAAIVIGTLTTLVVTANGWFSTKLSRLKLEEDTIQRQIGDLTAGRSNLTKQIGDLTIQRDQLLENLRTKNSFVERLSKEISDLRGMKTETSRKYQKQLEVLQADLDALKRPQFAIPPPPAIVLTGRVIEQGTETAIRGARVKAIDELTATDPDGIFRIYFHPNWEGLGFIGVVIDSPGYKQLVTTVKPSFDKTETFALVRN